MARTIMTDSIEGPKDETARARMEAMLAAMRRPAAACEDMGDEGANEDLLAAVARQAMLRGAPDTNEGERIGALDAGDGEGPETRVLDGSMPSSVEIRAAADFGARLGRYLPIDELGRGGMGRVLRAYDPKLEREVALKVLKAGAVDSQAWARMAREARTMAKLNHPHVVAVYDVVADPRHGHVIAMELVKGTTLKKWLEERPRSWREVLEAFIEAGRGLAAAHAQGLLHRDFKPANALVALGDREGARGPVKVTDFGLARRNREEPVTGELPVVSAEGRNRSGAGETLTEDGVLAGTPVYMAPEQHRGDTLTSAADQYAFCVALWEAVYGERPIGGSSLESITANVLEGRRRPPPKGRAIPGRLRRMCERGLSVHPQERWPSMEVLLTELRKLVAPRTRRWVALGLGAAAGAAAMAMSASPAPDPAAYCDDVSTKLEGVWDEPARTELRAAFAGTGLPLADATATQVIARLDERATQWTDAQSEACRREVEGREPPAVADVRMTCLARRQSSLGAMAAALRRADADAVMRAVEAVHDLPSPQDCLDASALDRRVAPVPEAEREAVAAVRSRLAEVDALRILGKLDEAQAKIEAARSEAESLSYGPLQAEAAMELALTLQEAGAMGPAEATIFQALTAGVAHDHDEVVAQAANALADLEQARMGSPVMMERWVSLGLAALGPLGGSAAHLRATLLTSRGQAQRLSGDLDGAIATLKEVLVLRERQWGPEHYAVAEPLGALGMAYARKGLHDESVRHIERAREILRATYGESHPNYAIALQNLATTHLVHGHYADTLAIYQDAHRLFRAGLGPRHPHVAVLAYNLATSLLMMERYDEALALVRQAQDIEDEVYGARSQASASNWSLLGEVHLRAGSLVEAEAALRQALAIHTEAAPDDRRARANYESQLGHALALAGRLPEADALLTATLQAQRELAGEPSVEVAETSGRLAMVRLAQGRLPEARALIDASVRQYEAEDPDPHQHAEAWFRRAQVLAAAGERAAAREEAERARARYAELGDQPVRRRAVEQWLAQP
jgi:tetratricopeptide (TPR) repeat protein